MNRHYVTVFAKTSFKFMVSLHTITATSKGRTISMVTSQFETIAIGVEHTMHILITQLGAPLI